jgi:hypothetical protein
VSNTTAPVLPRERRENFFKIPAPSAALRVVEMVASALKLLLLLQLIQFATSFFAAPVSRAVHRVRQCNGRALQPLAASKNTLVEIPEEIIENIFTLVEPSTGLKIDCYGETYADIEGAVQLARKLAVVYSITEMQRLALLNSTLQYTWLYCAVAVCRCNDITFR